MSNPEQSHQIRSDQTRILRIGGHPSQHDQIRVGRNVQRCCQTLRVAIISLTVEPSRACQLPLCVNRDTDTMTNFALQHVRPGVLHALDAIASDAQTVPQNCNMHLAQLHKQAVRTPDAQTAPWCSDSP